MTAAFALFLLTSMVLSGAVAFAGRGRPRLRSLLVIVLVLSWITLVMALAQIAARTASTLITPGAARRPQMVESAAREAGTLLASLGGPAAVVTGLAWLALRTARRGGQAPQTPAPRRHKSPRLLAVRGPGRDLEDSRRLVAEHDVALERPFDPDGLLALPGEFGPPRGRLLLARVGGEAAGCVGIRALAAGKAELDKLFVRASFRREGLGRALTQAACDEARRLGYRSVRVAVAPGRKDAAALFRSLQFYEIAPYRDGALPGALHLERAL